MSALRKIGALRSVLTAMTVLAAELDRRYRAEGLASVAFHPGSFRTRFAHDNKTLLGRATRSTALRRLWPSAEKGAERLLALVEGTPGTDWEAGAYLEKNRPVRRAEVTNVSLGKAVWDRTEELLADLVD